MSEINQENEHAAEVGPAELTDAAEQSSAPEVEMDAVEEAPHVETPPVERAKMFPPRRNLGTGRVSANSEQAVTSGGLSASRAAHWQQDGNALLTREAVAAWIERSGLVFYTPRGQQMGAPAPSLVQAVAGSADGDSSAAALGLLEALIAEGKVVPLNLLGVTGAAGTETPDYVCSAAVFSFVFTLRGNKAWKTAPGTTGAVKVSPLALAAYEALAAKGAMSAYDLTTELGKEVTGAAVLRALNELWAQLRVLPLLTADDSSTRWELASARFTRQIKAGANAGQPTALSALISLYLGQALAAEETEIESFLSPLAPRSRIREVLHALLGARQLETTVIDGKTLLHITGAAPVASAEVAKGEEPGAEAEQVGEDAAGSRIAKFTPKSGGKLGTGMRAKPAGARPGGPRPGRGASSGPRPASPGGKPAFVKFAGRGTRAEAPGAADGSGERERRPFRKPAFDKPAFNRPWEERAPRSADGDGASRPPRREAGRGFGAAGDRGAARPSRPFSKGPSFSKGPGFGAKREGGFAARGGARPSFGRSAEGDSRPPRRTERPGAEGAAFKRPYTPRPREGGGEDRPRPAFGKPAFGARPAYGAKPAGNFAARRPGPGATGAYPSRPRADAAGDEGEAPRKVFRKFDAPRGDKPYKAKPFGAGAGRPAAGGRSFAPRGDGPPRPASREGGADRPYRKSAPREAGGEGAGSRRPPARPAGPGRNAPFPARNSGAGRPAGGPAGGPFAKFAGGKRPFGKSAGRPRPAGDGPRGSGPRSDGGTKPTRRKRPEDE